MADVWADGGAQWVAACRERADGARCRGSSGAPPGCPAGTHNATGYGVGTGDPTTLQTQAAWPSSYFAPISCQAFSPVLTGNGGAIGLLESEGAGLSGPGSVGVFYRRFDPATRTFAGPVLVADETHASSGGAEQLSLSQDGAGGAYAAWHDSRGIVVSYSSSGGLSWGSAAATGLSNASNALITGVGGGSALLTYTATNAQGEAHQFIVPFSFQQLPH